MKGERERWKVVEGGGGGRRVGDRRGGRELKRGEKEGEG